MKLYTFLFSFVFFFASGAFSQWTTDTDLNTEVVPYSDASDIDVKSIGTSDGKTYVVFWESSPSYTLWLQVLDADGNKTLGPDGILISNNIPMSTYTSMWSLAVDSDDHLYIGVTGTANGAGLAFKIDIEGNHLWPPNGIDLGSGLLVTILPLEDGSAIVSWLSNDSKTEMQKFDQDGNQVWSNNKVVHDAWNNSPGNMFQQSDGYFTVVFHQMLTGINSYLYAQRFNADGEAQWLSPTQLSISTTHFNSYYYAAQDGDVIYYSYFGSVGNRFDSYVQRLNTDGSIPWGANGSDFNVQQTNYEMGTRIAFEEGSDYLWAICTYTNVNQSEYGEYVQKFDKEDGSRLFSETGKVIYPIGSDNVHAANLYLMNDQPMFVLKKGMDNGSSPVTLDMVYLDGNGDFLWPEQSKPMATYPANKNRISTPKPVAGQSVVVFGENKGSGVKIYAQNFVEETVSADNDIISFEITDQIAATEINTEDKSIFVLMLEGTDLSQLTPSITISENATIDPDSGTTQDFTQVFVYTVTAENGDEQEWTVTVDVNTGLNGLNGTVFQFYPNPSNGLIYFNNSSDFNLKEFLITDLSGKIIYLSPTDELQDLYQIDLSNESKGIYLVSITTSKGIYYEKLIIQ